MCDQGAVSIRKMVLPGMAIPMLKIRRPNDRLIFDMEIAIRRKDGLYIETGPWMPPCGRWKQSCPYKSNYFNWNEVRENVQKYTDQFTYI